MRETTHASTLIASGLDVDDQPPTRAWITCDNSRGLKASPPRSARFARIDKVQVFGESADEIV
jgi:hypothetical protein